MSHEYYRRGRNWFTAIGALFLIMAGIVFVRQFILWEPFVVYDAIVNNHITNEKVSLGMIAFGSIMIALGFRKNESQR